MLNSNFRLKFSLNYIKSGTITKSLNQIAKCFKQKATASAINLAAKNLQNKLPNNYEDYITFNVDDKDLLALNKQYGTSREHLGLIQIFKSQFDYWIEHDGYLVRCLNITMF